MRQYEKMDSTKEASRQVQFNSFNLLCWTEDSCDFPFCVGNVWQLGLLYVYYTSKFFDNAIGWSVLDEDPTFLSDLIRMCETMELCYTCHPYALTFPLTSTNPRHGL